MRSLAFTARAGRRGRDWRRLRSGADFGWLAANADGQVGQGRRRSADLRRPAGHDRQHARRRAEGRRRAPRPASRGCTGAPNGHFYVLSVQEVITPTAQAVRRGEGRRSPRSCTARSSRRTSRTTREAARGLEGGDVSRRRPSEPHRRGCEGVRRMSSWRPGSRRSRGARSLARSVVGLRTPRARSRRRTLGGGSQSSRQGLGARDCAGLSQAVRRQVPRA